MNAIARRAHPVAHADAREESVMKRLRSAAVGAAAARRHRAPERPPFECIALRQGGGALRSHQANVYAVLAEAELQPDWVAGISIGAINDALIAVYARNANQWRV